MYLTRTLEHFLLKASQQFPVMLVTGPRQVGKTTLLEHLSKDHRRYVTLDDPVLANLAREEPALFLQRFAPLYSLMKSNTPPNCFPISKLP